MSAEVHDTCIFSGKALSVVAFYFLTSVSSKASKTDLSKNIHLLGHKKRFVYFGCLFRIIVLLLTLEGLCIKRSTLFAQYGCKHPLSGESAL